MAYLRNAMLQSSWDLFVNNCDCIRHDVMNFKVKIETLSFLLCLERWNLDKSCNNFLLVRFNFDVLPALDFSISGLWTKVIHNSVFSITRWANCIPISLYILFPPLHPPLIFISTNRRERKFGLKINEIWKLSFTEKILVVIIKCKIIFFNTTRINRQL